MRVELAKTPLAGCVTLFLTLWLTGWSTVVLGIDIFSVRELLRQYESSTFPAVEGNITSSKVVRHRDIHDDADSLAAEINYDYFVAGNKYQGNRIRFGISSMGHPGKSVKRYPRGSEMPVYYDPAAPSVSVLEPGLATSDLFMPLFLVPFNMIMCGGIYLFVAARRERTGKRSRIKKRFNGLSTRYEVFTLRRPLAVCVVAGGAGFVAIFLFIFGSLLVPEGPLLVVLWTAVLAATGWTFWRVRPQTIDVDAARRSMSISTRRQAPTAIDVR